MGRAKRRESLLCLPPSHCAPHAVFFFLPSLPTTPYNAKRPLRRREPHNRKKVPVTEFFSPGYKRRVRRYFYCYQLHLCPLHHRQQEILQRKENINLQQTWMSLNRPLREFVSFWQTVVSENPSTGWKESLKISKGAKFAGDLFRSYSPAKWRNFTYVSLDENTDMHKFPLCKHVANLEKLRSKSGVKMANATSAW